MPPRLLIVICALASLSFATAAMTAETRIGLVDPTPQLLDAVSVALLPWGLRVVPVTGATLTGDIPSDKTNAGTLATAKGLDAVVWLAVAPGGPVSLCLYDRQTERVTVRPLARQPPFDEASAAAVALTLKTLLRTTTIAPVAERSSDEQGGPPAGSTLTPVPSPTVAPASAPPTASVSATATVPATTTVSARAPARSHIWRLDALLTAHLPTATAAALAPRAGLAVSAWPGLWREHVGFGLEVRAGTSLDFSSPLFVGTFADTAVTASARARIESERFSIELALGPSLQVTTFSGTMLATGHAASIVRADPSFDAAVVPQLTIGERLRLGVLLGSTLFLRTQRYVLHDESLLRLPPLGFDFGGRASLALD